MSASALIGLVADLAPWRKGMRNASEIVEQALGDKSLRPFDKAVDKSTKEAKDKFGGIGPAFAGAFGAVAGVVAALGIAKAFSVGTTAIWDSVQAADAYEDSLVKVDAALASLDPRRRGGFRADDLKGLTDDLRLALGTNAGEFNDAFADLLTRGFDPKQAQQLAVLAANYAIKTGKPLADVSRKIGDAANGSADAMKELGVQVATTGDKVADGKAAVLALKGAYGSLGTDLVDPIDQVNAALENLRIEFGQKLGPVIQPIIQNVADFANGLLATEEGREVIDEIVAAVQFGALWAKEAVKDTEALARVLWADGRLVVEVLKEIGRRAMALFELSEVGKETIPRAVDVILEAIRTKVLDWLRSNKLGQLFARQMMGLDEGELNAAADEAKANFRDASKGLLDAGKRSRAATDTLLGNNGTEGLDNAWLGAFEANQRATDIMNGVEGASGVEAFLNRIASAGRSAREAAAARVNAEQERTRQEGFAGDPARQIEEEKARQEERKRAEKEGKEREREAEKEQKLREQLAEKMQGRQAQARSPFGAGMSLTLADARRSPLGGRPARPRTR